MGFVRLPNEWADELCESPKLLAVVRLLRTRNYETGELTESVRTLSATTGLTTWQCREAIAYVTERIKAESAQIPHSMSHKIRTAESATDKGSGESAAQIPHTPPQDFRTQNKIQDSTKATTKNIYPLSFEGVWARYPKTNGSKADAFKAFQKANNISPLGNVGPQTRARINSIIAQKYSGSGGSTTPTTQDELRLAQIALFQMTATVEQLR